MRRRVTLTADHAVQFVLALTALFCAWVFYDLVLDDFAPLTTDAPTVLNTDPVPRNGALRIQYTLTVDRICTGEGERFFVDAAGTPHPAFIFSENTERTSDDKVLHVGDQITRQVSVPVPPGMAPGPATYQNRLTMYCNFWQHATRIGVPYAFPQIAFSVADSALPQVAHSQSIFKMSPHNDVVDWFRKYVHVGD